MIFFKYFVLFLIFALASFLGGLISRKYKNRVDELKSFKEAYNILKSKIQFTYKPIGDIFEDITELIRENNITKVFQNTSNNMKNEEINYAWENAIDTSKDVLNLKAEDLNILKGLGKMLGKTDIQGQISEIDLNINFLDTQIKKAEEEQKKNEKLYKTLGTIVGLAIIIILI